MFSYYNDLTIRAVKFILKTIFLYIGVTLKTSFPSCRLIDLWPFSHVTKQIFSNGELINHYRRHPFIKRTASLQFARDPSHLWTVWGHCGWGGKSRLQWPSAAPGSRGNRELADQTARPCQTVGLFIPKDRGDPDEAGCVELQCGRAAHVIWYRLTSPAVFSQRRKSDSVLFREMLLFLLCSCVFSCVCVCQRFVPCSSSGTVFVWLFLSFQTVSVNLNVPWSCVPNSESQNNLNNSRLKNSRLKPLRST